MTKNEQERLESRRRASRKWRLAHPDRAKESQSRYDAAHAGKKRNIRLKARYGITSAEYDLLFESQGGRCAICRGYPTGGKYHPSLTVDHDHETGRIRALLCHRCNAALGMFNDDATILDEAASYLRRHS